MMTSSPKGLIGPTLLATKSRLKKAPMKARLIRLDVDTYSIGTLYFVVLTNYYYLVALLSTVCIRSYMMSLHWSQQSMKQRKPVAYGLSIHPLTGCAQTSDCTYRTDKQVARRTNKWHDGVHLATCLSALYVLYNHREIRMSDGQTDTLSIIISSKKLQQVI